MMVLLAPKLRPLISRGDKRICSQSLAWPFICFVAGTIFARSFRRLRAIEGFVLCRQLVYREIGRVQLNRYLVVRLAYIPYVKSNRLEDPRINDIKTGSC